MKECAELHAASGTNRFGHDAATADAVGADPLGEAGQNPDTQHNPPSLWAVIVRWAVRGTVAAFLVSLLVHLFGLVIAGLIVLGDGRGGSPRGSPEPVGFAVMTEGELAEMQAAGLVAETPSVPEIASGPTAVDQSLVDESIAQAGEGSISELSSLGAATGGGEISGDGLGGVGGSGGGGGGASFFGVEAQGSRFAFVVDVSGSMSVGGKLEALRSSLLETLSGFNDASSFLIVPYSSEAMPLGNKRSWTEANTNGKRWARQLVMKLAADGATNPGPAFQIIFAQRPRPDAIYFMTDGEFDPQVADDIKVLNSELRIPVHCITLETRDSEDLMKRIAAESKGTYTFIPGQGGRTP